MVFNRTPLSTYRKLYVGLGARARRDITAGSAPFRRTSRNRRRGAWRPVPPLTALREYHAERVQPAHGAAALFHHGMDPEFLVHLPRDDMLPAQAGGVAAEQARPGRFPPPGHSAV